MVYGFMPAKTTLFDSRANVVHQLPSGPRNTILFSPHARFVLVAGFGNLQGQIDVYDRQAGMRKIVTIESSNPSICEWSPDGRHILTATTSPRLRVDNGIMIWHYTGELMYKADFEELYHVCWRPQPNVHKLPNPLPSAPDPHSSALSHVAAAPPKKATGAYRPPHARGSETPLHFKREDEGGAAHIYANGGSVPSGGGLNGFGKGRRREVPGAAGLVSGAAPGGGVSLVGTGIGADEDSGLSKAALKNKKKREAAKKAKTDGTSGDNTDGGREGRSASEGLKVPKANGRGRSKSPAGSKAAPKKAPAPVVAPVEEEPQDDKKVRGLLKKLRAIDELKMRLANGEKLEDTQLKKIKTEDGVRKELEALGANP